MTDFPEYRTFVSPLGCIAETSSTQPIGHFGRALGFDLPRSDTTAELADVCTVDMNTVVKQPVKCSPISNNVLVAASASDLQCWLRANEMENQMAWQPDVESTIARNALYHLGIYRDDCDWAGVCAMLKRRLQQHSVVYMSERHKRHSRIVVLR